MGEAAALLGLRNWMRDGRAPGAGSARGWVNLVGTSLNFV